MKDDAANAMTIHLFGGSPATGCLASNTTRLLHASELLRDLFALCGHPHPQTKTCTRS
jgi:hypothetical protein